MRLISFAILSVHKDCFHFYIMLTKLLYSCFVSFFDLYKEYKICLISFLSFSELFPAFDWAKVIGNLLRILLGVSIFSPCPCWFCFLNSRIFSTASIISLGFTIYFYSSLMFSVSFFKLINPLLIIFTKSLFLYLSIILYKSFNISPALWKLK